MKNIGPSRQCQKAIKRAISVARATGSTTLSSQHFVLAMLYGNNSATRCLRKLGVPIIEMRRKWMRGLPDPAEAKPDEVHASQEWQTVMNRAELKAAEGKCESINVLHVFVAIIDIDGIIADFLEAFSVAAKKIYQFLAELTAGTRAWLTPQIA
jgi:ATP-dependent Clp protease ATP-binding subunit ClpA